MQDNPHAAIYSAAVDSALKARNLMINQAATEASSHTLSADKVLSELIGKANVYAEDDVIFQRAISRMQKGNPPGKSGSVGDQYNWEYLLQNVPNEDLHIVSKDSDYVSGMNTGRAHPFLEKEWSRKKNACLYLYSELRPFIDKYLISLESEAALIAEQVHQTASSIEHLAPAPSDQNREIEESNMAVQTMTMESVIAEKNSAITDLIDSMAFTSTHSAIAKLEELRATLSKDDVELLFTAALNNNQIAWIASDSDVFAFFTALLNEHYDIKPELSLAVAELFGLTRDEEDMDPRD